MPTFEGRQVLNLDLVHHWNRGWQHAYGPSFEDAQIWDVAGKTWMCETRFCPPGRGALAGRHARTNSDRPRSDNDGHGGVYDWTRCKGGLTQH